MWHPRMCYSLCSYTAVGTEEFSTPQGRVFAPRTCLGCWHNGFNRPVLKHGPRSLTRARVFGCFKPERAAKTKVETSVAEGTDARTRASREGSAVERARWDPKDGELCLNRAKPEETLVEARSDSDVQIDRRIWV